MPLHASQQPKTIQEVSTFRCELCREKKVRLKCNFCAKYKSIELFPEGAQQQHAASRNLEHKDYRCLECSNPQCQNPFCQLCPHCRSRECTRRTGCTRKPVPLNAKQQLKNIDELSTFECDLCLFPRCNGSRCKIEMTKKQKEDYRKKEYWSTMSMKKREWTCKSCR